MNRLLVFVIASLTGITGATLALSQPPPCNGLLASEPADCVPEFQCNEIESDCPAIGGTRCEARSIIPAQRQNQCESGADPNTYCIMDWTPQFWVCFQQWGCVYYPDVATCGYTNALCNTNYSGDAYSGSCVPPGS